MAKITCPHCGQNGSISNSAQGFTLRCSRCHSLFLLRFDAIVASGLAGEPLHRASAGQNNHPGAQNLGLKMARTVDWAKPRIVLVVADDEIIREGLTMILTAANYEVATAENGREALKYLQSCTAPDLCLVDLMAADYGDWEFLRRRARDAALTATPVIVLTGPGARIDHDASLGGVNYLSKPVPVATLLEHLKGCLEVASA